MFKYKTIRRDTRSIVAFIIILSSLLETNARTQRNIQDICKEIRSQTAYSLSEMTGFWYGIEILEHLARTRPAAESCIKVDIATGKNDHVYLTWKERNLAVKYTFYVEDREKRGVWTSLGDQDVSEKPFGFDYEQFAGKVFVVRASDNLVLTFCSATKVFTLVLSKNYTMNSTELDSIHSSLGRFHVPQIKDSKRYCKNGAFNIQPENFLIVFIGFVVFKMYAKNS